MGIPTKVWMRLLDSVTDFRKDPGPDTEAAMENGLESAGWPWNANAAQLDEYQNLMDRTRGEFEARVAICKEHDASMVSR